MEAINGDESKPMKEIYPVVAGSKAPVCRCWQSKKFPLCDGSHNAYNKETGSHVGPLVISAQPKE
ncbi:CDGSH iron-sulfur domain-containing protein 1 [Gracilariopsis chorda]|uniref:CDGSH iron-sulfur domain-containing protein 1 n=1 Tax=Gracilariopsis chorda TaxID=448386 RepID=A0A2V3IWL3_9FLOR|nr:CDGSH iron-sulfur domain-containing protein 1 [Gracilariopsis chorda]|eukprot:PXF46479.1 CDGSH iron-sulfur domain-containing protein 1 [Gracilariopsis chorda]